MRRRDFGRVAAALTATLFSASPVLAIDPPKHPQRVVSLGGGITEIVYALDAGGMLVGGDLSSVYPARAQQLPRVGYYRDVSVEGVAMLKPDLVLASDQAGPPAAIERLRALGIRVVTLSDEPTLAALDGRIQAAADVLGVSDRGRALTERIHARARTQSEAATGAPRVLSLLSHGGPLQAAGAGTSADAILGMAGLHNVAVRQRGYKPVSPESIAAMGPDVIVVTTATLATQGGLDKFLAQPGVAVTPAGRNRRVVVMDDLLYLGFGPRLPEALTELTRRVQSVSTP